MGTGKTLLAIVVCASLVVGGGCLRDVVKGRELKQRRDTLSKFINSIKPGESANVVSDRLVSALGVRPWVIELESEIILQVKFGKEESFLFGASKQQVMAQMEFDKKRRYVTGSAYVFTLGL